MNIAPSDAFSGPCDSDAANQTRESPYHMVRGLERGLQVLEDLNRHGEASAAQVAKRVGLPRPTTHRLLETLRSLGFVWRPHLRDAYRLTAKVHVLSDGHQRVGWIEELAAPLLLRLAEQLVWPVNLSTFEDNAMVLRIHTHRDSPLSLVKPLPGTRVPVLTTAVGQVHLAFSSEKERFWILEMLSRTLPPGTDVEQWRPDVLTMVESVRRAGHAISENVGDGGRSASLAVPITTTRIGEAHSEVLACLNVLWIRSALGRSAAIERFRPALVEVADEICRLFEERTYRARVDTTGSTAELRPAQGQAQSQADT